MNIRFEFKILRTVLCFHLAEYDWTMSHNFSLKQLICDSSTWVQYASSFQKKKQTGISRSSTKRRRRDRDNFPNSRDIISIIVSSSQPSEALHSNTQNKMDPVIKTKLESEARKTEYKKLLVKGTEAMEANENSSVATNLEVLTELVETSNDLLSKGTIDDRVGQSSEVVLDAQVCWNKKSIQLGSHCAWPYYLCCCCCVDIDFNDMLIVVLLQVMKLATDMLGATVNKIESDTFDEDVFVAGLVSF